MLFLTLASLLATAVFALRGDQTRIRYTEVEDRDVELFRNGQTYKYRLDTQIASGIASVSNQHAVTRLQAEAQFHFTSDRLVALKLKDVTIGTTNQEIENPEQIQPIQLFKETALKPEDLRLLELPCEFDYADGLVESVRFHQQDQSWSKNIKKSVLNMLQINLKQRKGMNVELEQTESWQKEREQQDLLTKSENQIQQRMFVMPEITLEGECQVTYAINPVSRDEKLKMFNVTKTVDFHRCKKIADIQYGPKIEKPCKNCTSQQELEERKLDRTTIMRHVVAGTPEKYGIKKVETISHYVFKTLNVLEESPMHTIVTCRLNLVRAENDRSEIERELRRIETDGKSESLLYSIEFDTKEKLFYMFGDEEFAQKTPFDMIKDKVVKVESTLKKLVGMWSDKVKGIETEATLIYTRLVELLRMCTVSELEEICSRVKDINRKSETEEVNAEHILIDALANAGTLNTIKVLVEKVKKGHIQPTRATRAIIQLKDLPAPSEKQMKVLTELCENNVCKQHEPCYQVCWLTVGNLVGELCNDELTVDDAVEMLKPQCHKQLKTDFVSKIMRTFEKFETRYRKIMILKALGNAGLEQSVTELEKIIRNLREDPLVRMQAIDSLRRLRAVMPHKIQRVLMPVFQNVRERPEVRMMAASLILATFPERPILDQIGFTLLREPNRQVKSYIYRAMKALSKSPIEVELEVARHLKSLLKLAGVTEEDEEFFIRGSRFYRIPVYCHDTKEGLFFDVETMFGSDDFLPKHLTTGLDTVFNGLFQKNTLEISFTQEDVEQWFEKLMDMYMDFGYGSTKSKLRAGRRSSQESDESDFGYSKIIKGLGISRRVDSDSDRKNNAPYAMLNFRYKDIDFVMLPLEEEFLPHTLKKVLTSDRQPTIDDLKDLIEIFQGRKFHSQVAMNLMEHSIKIPTTAGLPIRMWHVIPMLASVQGQCQAEIRGELKATIKLHPMISLTHLKRIEVWSPIVHTGVESTRTMSVNIPLNTQLIIANKTFKMTLEVPEKEYRIVHVHTLPLTYVTEQEWFQQRTPLIKRIENQNLVHRLKRLENTYCKRNLGMPIKITGEVHVPHTYSYKGIISTLLTTENHLLIDFVPEEESPRKIVITGEGRFFESSTESRTSHRELKSFHSKSVFDTEMDSYYEDENKDERQFNKFLEEYEPTKLYKHFVSVEIKTVGGRHEKQAQMEIEAHTDSEHRYVKALLKMKRSALPSMDERSPWTMKTQVQLVLPDVLSTIQQYKQQEEQMQLRLVAKINTEWGCEEKQLIRLNINGKQARNPEWRQKISEIERLNNPDARKLYQQMIRKAAFLNKYDISADYENLTPETKIAWNLLNALLKTRNFWQTKVESKKLVQSQRSGQLTATIVIDPMTHKHANVTLKTPVEIIRIESLTLPMKMKPFKLVKPGQMQKSIDSFYDIVRDYTVENRQECKVSKSKIETFDGVVFKAPLTKCYSVLAKDCGSKNPRFAVLMKKIDNQDKAIKVMIRGDVIEVQPEDGKLVVMINGKLEKNEKTLKEFGIDYNSDMVRIANRDLTVRFDGKECSVKIASTHKNIQCGLCGHYDDDSDDEFRMSNNELTSDLKSYHKSFSLVDDECNSDFAETHRQEEYKQLKGRRYEYDYDDDETFGKNKRQRKNDNNEIDPIEKTQTMEYNQKVCFSVKPVKSCPEESYPGKTKEMKVGFVCFDRSSTEARRLLREARRSDEPVKLPSTKPSFVETITVPSTCEVY